MKYKRYMYYFFMDKNLIWAQIGFWALFFMAFNMPTHALYHNKFAIVASLIPTVSGLIIGTIMYFIKMKSIAKRSVSK